MFHDFFWCTTSFLLHIKNNIKKLCEMCKARRRGKVELLTVGVVLLPDSIHSPVRPYSQEESPVFTVEPFGILEAPRRKATAAAVFRCRGKRCDFSCGHLLLFSRFLATASSPSSAVQKPHRGLLPPTNRCLFPPPLLPSSTELHTNWFYLTLEVRLLEHPPLRAASAIWVL